MINDLHQALPQEIRVLQDSAFTFQLTGSRFFGNATDDSDWDFFALHTPELVSFLKDRGYVEMGVGVEDVEVSTIYRHLEHKVDIQLVTVLSDKIEAQAFIKTVFPKGMETLPSKERCAVWALVGNVQRSRFKAPSAP